MVSRLWRPEPRILVPKMPSYVKLDMAMDGASDSYLFDKSRYRSHGAITGASWATGLHGKALDFVSATPSYVEIDADYDQLDFTLEYFSVVIRIKLDSLTTNPMFICRGLTDTDGWLFSVDSGGRLQAFTFQLGANQKSNSPANTVVVLTRSTIGFSRSGSSIKFYKNGANVVFTVGTHINPATSTRSTKIGIYDNKSTGALDGQIEFLRVFGGIALSASEHLAWHNALA